MKNKKKIFIIIVFVLETVILTISVAYSSLIFLIKDAKVEWFDEISSDGNYHVKCYKVGSSLFFSPQELLIYFNRTGTSDVNGTNSVSFSVELANDGANLYDDNYEIQWLSDSVKIIFRGEETGGDNIYQIPYLNSEEDTETDIEELNVTYNLSYGEIFEISDNTI